MSSPPPIAPDTERLLIICPSWVGDAVMATPLLRAARTRLPGARIIGLMRPGIDELLAGLPSFDERIATDLRGLFGPARVAREIRRRCPQAALLLPNSFRSALCLWLSGTPTRVGYDRDGRGRLLTHRHAVVRADRPTPLLDYYASLATFALGAAEIDPRPQLAVTEAEAAEAERLLAVAQVNLVDTTAVFENWGLFSGGFAAAIAILLLIDAVLLPRLVRIRLLLVGHRRLRLLLRGHRALRLQLADQLGA